MARGLAPDEAGRAVRNLVKTAFTCRESTLTRTPQADQFVDCEWTQLRRRGWRTKSHKQWPKVKLFLCWNEQPCVFLDTSYFSRSVGLVCPPVRSGYVTNVMNTISNSKSTLKCCNAQKGEFSSSSIERYMYILTRLLGRDAGGPI